MSDYGAPNLYRTPRYDQPIAEALSEAALSPMWDDWDLAGLLVDVPTEYAARVGVKHGIFCSTGTSGLHACLMALELLPGDEVVVPCMTFIRAVTPLVHLGLQPVLADIDPLTGNLDPNDLEKCIGPRTRAVIVVHMWGIPADMDAITAICRKRGLLLIEDWSHAHFSRHSSGTVGSFGDVSFASLQRKKTLAVGEGGIIVTNERMIYERLQQITSPGSFKGTQNYNEFSGFGLNLRMSPFAAVVARTLLPRIDSIVESKARHRDAFDELLRTFTDFIRVPYVPSYAVLVSAYGYKPSITARTSLSKLTTANASGLWRFGPFSYDHIRQSPFWRKSRSHYPFALQIQPRESGAFPGYAEYVNNRVSLSVPTIRAEYWTQDVLKQWAEKLKNAFEA